MKETPKTPANVAKSETPEVEEITKVAEGLGLISKNGKLYTPDGHEVHDKKEFKVPVQDPAQMSTTVKKVMDEVALARMNGREPKFYRTPSGALARKN